MAATRGGVLVVGDDFESRRRASRRVRAAAAGKGTARCRAMPSLCLYGICTGSLRWADTPAHRRENLPNRACSGASLLVRPQQALRHLRACREQRIQHGRCCTLRAGWRCARPALSSTPLILDCSVERHSHYLRRRRDTMMPTAAAKPASAQVPGSGNSLGGAAAIAWAETQANIAAIAAVVAKRRERIDIQVPLVDRLPVQSYAAREPWRYPAFTGQAPTFCEIRH